MKFTIIVKENRAPIAVMYCQKVEQVQAYIAARFNEENAKLVTWIAG